MRNYKVSEIMKEKKDPIDDINISVSILEKESRFKILLHLIGTNELSLGELTERIGKSKSTISRDLQELIAHNMVLESRIDKTTKSKYYTIDRDFLYDTTAKLTNPETLDTLTPDGLKNNFNLLIEMVIYSVFILNNTLPLVGRYLELFKDARQDIKIENRVTFEQWLKDMNFHFRFTPLSKEGYEIHEKHYREFVKNVNEELYQVEKNKAGAGEYITWNLVFPIQKILKWTKPN
ncbi:MAG: winged helix-turn-helix transcriptional regulator [Asgard group archaeon]|nr:winged helix-turn-helix transcriptional regulator [Asgard group archaeon]